ncbi:plastocyanin/azurin family copper-binding protein [Variovorax ginsengisoli]|uniref:Plastocyanin/azurin family copper-binding protein n=1 Tax=Variovorax ginsengisoli TaxID=363844 RepID=A0ABT8RW23_9BURK|nr:plastocyanin/azurin family copper-binding protein [Variovorax ginsengisoli]MDN8611621.1 plastocyanin/azurin family copper-binding protein [Variovorax ginsengisoli]MDO1530791.1 plastocyanin/azurin family copper-binding protein [Variovorax ginsengisoli]
MKRHPILATALAALMLANPAFAAGPKAYVGNFKDNTVSVIDTGSQRLVATVPVAAGPDGIAVGRNDRQVFVSGASASSLSVIDTATDRIVDTVEVGKGPQGLALTPDGRWLLVAVNGEDRVAFVDAATHAVAATVPVAKPHTLTVSPDGKRAYVSSQAPGSFALVVIDLPTRAVAASVPLEKTPRDLELSPDGKVLYVTMAGLSAVQVFDTASNKPLMQIPTGVSPHVAHLFAGARSGVVVVQGPGELMLFDPATQASTGSIAVGKQPHWVDMLPGGKKVLVTNEGSNDVSLVDLAGGPVVTIPVGNAPRKVAVQHRAAGGSAKVSINNFAFGPAQLAINAGDSVTWTNDDGAPHGLAFNDGAPGTTDMLPGQSFSRVFAKAGVFDYVCSVHPYMMARVTVQ